MVIPAKIGKKKLSKVDEYINQYPENVKDHLNKIKSLVSAKDSSITFDIKYGIPTAILNKKNLLHFAAFKNHIGFYPIPKTINAFKEKLLPYKQGKGSIQFQLNQEIPFDLIDEMIIYRINEFNSK